MYGARCVRGVALGREKPVCEMVRCEVEVAIVPQLRKVVVRHLVERVGIGLAGVKRQLERPGDVEALEHRLAVVGDGELRELPEDVNGPSGRIASAPITAVSIPHAWPPSTNRKPVSMSHTASTGTAMLRIRSEVGSR